MKLTVIANPYAGRGRVQDFLGPFVTRAEAMGRRIDLELTQRPGHAVELARSAAATADAICVVGGDGTVHEVANGLLPNPVPMVVIPCGSGDDFARLVGCPRNAEELFAVVEDGVGVELDVLDCGERYCVNSCGLGFEAQVTKNSRSIQRLKGLPLYLLALGKALVEFNCPELKITLENGDVISGERLLVSVGNGISAGGGFFLTPDAVPDDGLIDLCVVEKMGRVKMMGLLPLSLKGTHTTRREVDMRRTRSLTVESKGPLHFHIDGEYLGDERRSISFELLERRLPVLCKKDSPGRFSQTPRKLL
jgi:YegS/Rv2252/BmrU family lipid kinase